MKRDFFSHNKSLIDSYELVQKRNNLITEWEINEVGLALLPGESFLDENGEYKEILQPSPFSFGSMVTIVIMALLVVPIIVFGIFIFLSFIKRMKKLKEIRDLEYEIRSIFPKVYDEKRDKISSYVELAMIQVLISEGIVISDTVVFVE